MPERPCVFMLDALHNEKSIDLAIETEILGDSAQLSLVQIADRDHFHDKVFEADALIVSPYPRLSADILRSFRKLQLIVRNGVGYDNVDVTAARELGIPVSNVPDYGTEEVADHALLLTLALERNLYRALNAVRAGSWSWQAAQPTRRLRGQRFGIVGCGRIGTAAALRAKAFGFAVRFYDPYVASGYEKAIGVGRSATLAQLLETSDVISLHCPLTAETHGILSLPQLQAMKVGAFLVNTARGPLIPEADLLQVLRSGHLGGIALDVIEREPEHSPELLTFSNCLLTPHTAFYSEESLADLRAGAARIVLRFLRGEGLMNVVN
jgi:phosphoglycerate dehydrogenase-like enzyme